MLRISRLSSSTFFDNKKWELRDDGADETRNPEFLRGLLVMVTIHSWYLSDAWPGVEQARRLHSVKSLKMHSVK